VESQLTGQIASLTEGAVRIWLAVDGDRFISFEELFERVPDLVGAFGEAAIEAVVAKLVEQELLLTEQQVLLGSAQPSGRPQPIRIDGLIELIREEVQGLSLGRILEVGCGTGELLAALAELGPDTLLGVDINRAYVEGTRTLLTARGIEAILEWGMAEALPIDDDSIDLLVVDGGLAWFDRDKFWREAQRITSGTHRIVVIEHDFVPSSAEPSEIGVALGLPPFVRVTSTHTVRHSLHIGSTVIVLEAIKQTSKALAAIDPGQGLDRACERCGTRWGDLLGSGYLACPGCYASFEPLLLQAIQQYHRVGERLDETALSGDDSDLADVVLTSRVRLARSIAGFAFPHRLSCEESHALVSTVAEALRHAPELEHVLLERLDELDDEEAVGAVARVGASSSILVLEEDHLRLLSVRAGGDLREAYLEAKRIDAALAQVLCYAEDCRLGHLTACLTNVGTGMRASCLLHLPALAFTGEIHPALELLAERGIVSRGLYGESSHSRGSFFQVSNEWTLGPSEAELLSQVLRAACHLATRERAVRDQLKAQPPVELDDRVRRALATLQAARSLPLREALTLLSLVRLGEQTGLLHTRFTEVELAEWVVGLGPSRTEDDAQRAARVQARLGRFDGS
jgi:protein arginine kinase